MMGIAIALLAVVVVVVVLMLVSAAQDYTIHDSHVDRLRADNRLHRITWQMKADRARRDIDELFED